MFERLVTGQIRETAGAPPGSDGVEHYLRLLEEKTGSLIATCALFGGASAPAVEVLRRFGSLIGVAFPLFEDLLDVAFDSAVSGKTPGTDLREGVRTLPALYALRSPDRDPASVRLRELLAVEVPDEATIGEALALLRQSPAMDEARGVLVAHADRARAVLDGLPDVPARAALLALTDYVVAPPAEPGPVVAVTAAVAVPPVSFVI
jgi:heptaprenyl diphosphate synthase